MITRYDNFVNELFDSAVFTCLSKNKKRAIYEFDSAGKKYLVYFNNVGKDMYHLSFCLLDEDGTEVFDLLGMSGNSFSVLGNVRNITVEFLKNNKVDLLVFSSSDTNRNFIYSKFGTNLKEFFDEYEIVRDGGKDFFVLMNSDVNGDMVDNVIDVVNSK